MFIDIRYYECNIKGEEKEKLCDDGYVFDISAQHCDYPSKVNCTGRPKLRKCNVSFLKLMKSVINKFKPLI